MARNQKGGVHTQKLSSFAIIAMVVLAGATCFCFVGDDSAADASANTVSTSADFGKVGTTITFTLNGESAYDYKIYRMVDGSETDKKTGTLSGESSYSATVDITLPSTEGTYTYEIEYLDSDSKSVFTDSIDIKAVKAITLKATITNDSSNTISLYVYFLVKENGESVKVENSEQIVDVEAGKSKDVTCEYIVKNVSDIEFCITSNSDSSKSLVSGLDEWKTVYSSDNDYTFITVFLAIVIVIMIIAIIWIYRKPVINTGKPKSRR